MQRTRTAKPTTGSPTQPPKRLRRAAVAMLATAVVLTTDVGTASAASSAYTSPSHLGYGAFRDGIGTVTLSACDTYSDSRRVVVRFRDYYQYTNPIVVVEDANGANNGCVSKQVYFRNGGLLKVQACTQNGGDPDTRRNCGAEVSFYT